MYIHLAALIKFKIKLRDIQKFCGSHCNVAYQFNETFNLIIFSSREKPSIAVLIAVKIRQSAIYLFINILKFSSLIIIVETKH